MPQPPDAETAARQVAALYNFFGAGRISPELVGKVENVREKIGDMNEGRAFS
jgi:hypothetical protein